MNPHTRPHTQPHTRRLSDLVRGAGALLVIGAILIGLPVVLYAVAGSPVPHGVPTPDEIWITLTRPDDGRLFLAALRLITWGAWCLFTATMLVELVAQLRGRKAPRMPGLGSLQRWTGRLIASAALVFIAPAPAVLATASAPVPAVAAVSPTFQGMSIPPAATTVSPSFHEVSAATPVNPAADRHDQDTYKVRQGDCLWRLADRHLGDGERWPEIFKLNRGRSMSDGRSFTNPHLIHPAWSLRMPAGATALPRTHASDGRKQIPVAQHPGHPSKDPGFASPHPSAGATAAAPRAAETHRPAQAPAGTGMTAAAGTGSAKSSVQAPEDDSLVAPVLAAFMGGMLAGGVLTTLARMRHRQRQHRRTGRRIKLPEDRQVIRHEQTLHRVADIEGGSLLRVALRAMAEGIRRDGLPVPSIVGVHLVPGTLEILLAHPTDAAPAPFQITPGSEGMCWELDQAGLAVIEAAPRAELRADDPLPGLVTAGRTDLGGYLLLDLEAQRVTACEGPADVVEEVLLTAATEVATNPWAGWFDTLLVGFDELAPIEDRVEVYADLDKALTVLDDRGKAMRRRLPPGSPIGDVRSQRLLTPGDDELMLTLLITRYPPNPAQMTRLLDIVGDTGGLAALIPDAQTHDGRQAPARFELQTGTPDEPPRMHVHPLGLSVCPQPLTRETYAHITALFATAADVADVGIDAQPYDLYSGETRIPAAGEVPAAAAQPAPEPVPVDLALLGTPVAPLQAAAPAVLDGGPEPQPEPVVRAGVSPATGPAVQIRILGPLEVVGAAQSLRPKQVELLLVLALHGSAGLRHEQLCTLLGADPDHPKSSDTLRQMITRARRGLGMSADGRERIMHTGDSVYRIHDVGLDWDHFQGLVSQAVERGPQGAEQLRQALSLIRGKPFAGCYHWWLEAPLLETIRAGIVDAAELLAELELLAGDPAAAGRAARSGLVADPAAEQLWRMVMRAEHASGNMAGVREGWVHCLRELSEVSVDGEPHRETVTLYQALSA